MLKNLLVLLSGAVVTVLVLGISSGMLTNWVKSTILPRLSSTPSPTPTAEPMGSVQPSIAPSPESSITKIPAIKTTPKPTSKPTSKPIVTTTVIDQQAPSMNFEGPWKNGEGQTCVKVVNISDNITPSERLIKSERMDDNNWRDLHAEYCISGNTNDTHKYQVRVKDEQGNEATSTFTFPIL